MMSNEDKTSHIGSSLHDFLEEDGALEAAKNIALKRVISFQIIEAMEKLNLSKTKLAEEMGTSRSALDRLLDPHNDSVTLETLKKAAQATGNRLELRFVEEI